MLTRRMSLTAVVLLGSVTLSGCSSLGPDAASAGEAALAFYAAYDEEDGPGACELLTENARTELEQSTDMPCDEAILSEDLPSAEQVVEIAAYGRNARVVLDGDVVFLSVADGEWRVIAAGCKFQSEAPYDCTITGG